jgi:hypothetical protein
MVDRKSWRIAELAKRNHLSPAFIYNEINAGRLRARKAGAATIVTEEDEQAWLDAMPVIEPSKSNESETA